MWAENSGLYCMDDVPLRPLTLFELEPGTSPPLRNTHVPRLRDRRVPSVEDRHVPLLSDRRVPSPGRVPSLSDSQWRLAAPLRFWRAIVAHFSAAPGGALRRGALRGLETRRLEGP